MPGNRRSEHDILVPAAASALDALKLEVAREIGWNPADLTDLRNKISGARFEVARELGIPLQAGYNGDLPSRYAGAIGGRLGGRLGGQMVRRLIARAEEQLAPGAGVPGTLR